MIAPACQSHGFLAKTVRFVLALPADTKQCHDIVHAYRQDLTFFVYIKCLFLYLIHRQTNEQ